VNTTSEELSNVAMEVSVWDLEGTCPLSEVHDKLTALPKNVTPIVEMKYPKSKNPKPVYFLLLKLYNMSDNKILSRNFYWLHLPGGDYKLLEPYREKKIPLKITSEVFIQGSTYKLHMHVQNTSKKPDSNSLTLEHGSTARQKLETVNSVRGTEQVGWLTRIQKCFAGKSDGLKVSEINGQNIGVAFFLHFSVHASNKDHKEGEDTRILPVHYSDNYFSLVPGETMTIKISFEVPPGVTPRVSLHGWNFDDKSSLNVFSDVTGNLVNGSILSTKNA